MSLRVFFVCLARVWIGWPCCVGATRSSCNVLHVAFLNVFFVTLIIYFHTCVQIRCSFLLSWFCRSVSFSPDCFFHLLLFRPLRPKYMLFVCARTWCDHTCSSCPDLLFLLFSLSHRPTHWLESSSVTLLASFPASQPQLYTTTSMRTHTCPPWPTADMCDPMLPHHLCLHILYCWTRHYIVCLRVCLVCLPAYLGLFCVSLHSSDPCMFMCDRSYPSLSLCTSP